MAANRGLQAASFATLLSLSLSLSVSLNSRSYKSCVEQVVTPSSFRSGHNRDNDARGEGERERARLAEGKAEIWRSSCSIQLESSREIGRGRKRRVCVCVCVRMCTRVQGVLLFLGGRVALADSLKRRGRLFFANIFSSISDLS